MAYTLIATDTTSYPNMTLYTYAKENGTLARHDLIPNEGYVIHYHEICNLGDEEHGIEPECYYYVNVGLPPQTDLSTINDQFQAVLRSSVPENSIFGNDKPDHEVM